MSPADTAAMRARVQQLIESSAVGSAFDIENHPADDAPREEVKHWMHRLRAEIDHNNRIEAIALEAALRVFAETHPVGARDRSKAFAAMAIEAGEVLARAWETRKRR